MLVEGCGRYGVYVFRLVGQMNRINKSGKFTIGESDLYVTYILHSQVNFCTVSQINMV